ncbi:MAG: DNA cytosine methyltransferase [Promethearchaeota archaeon]
MEKLEAFEFEFRCLDCGSEVPPGRIKFVKSERYSRKYRTCRSPSGTPTDGGGGRGGPGGTTDELEISACPECGTRKGFRARYLGENTRPHLQPRGSLKLVDLFCGCGGMSEGFQEEGFRTVAGLDVNVNMIRTFALNHPESNAIVGDINRISARDLLLDTGLEPTDVDVVVGGPPCQGFSTVGDRYEDDPRNRLFYQFVRMVREIQPKAFVMENVPGILTMRGGRVRDLIIGKFEEEGYAVGVRKLMAVDYGVPQRRARVFFVGNRFGEPPEDLFPPAPAVPAGLPGENQRTLDDYRAGGGSRAWRAGKAQSPVTVDDAIGDLPGLAAGEGEFVSEYGSAPRTPYQRRMRRHAKLLYNHESPRHSDLVLSRIRALGEGQNHRDLPPGLQLSSGYPNIYGRLWSDRPSDVITGNYGCVSAPGRFIHPRQDRVLTVREGARLQSFPDDFIVLGSNKSIQYKQVGNAVPPLLARALATRLREMLE